MRLLRPTLLATLAALTLSPGLAGSAQAYSPDNTHRWLARQAVELLVKTYPGEYDELLEYIDDIVEGAYHEDDFLLDGDDDPKTLRVMRHFYHAPDGAGLAFNGKQFPSSFEWNGQDNEQNKWDFHDGLRAYQEGDFAQAFFIAGHTTHLIQDLTVPAHSHSDQHGPPFGDDYESFCASRSYSPTDADLPRVAPNTSIPDFENLEALFQATANASYFRNLYPGHLPTEGDASGIIVEMFPGMGIDWLSGDWKIPDVGALDKAFFEHQPDRYYFKKNSAMPMVDMVDYDPSNPGATRFAAMDASKSMTERMAEDLIPVAILHSAAALKLFTDEARSLPPTTDRFPDDNTPGEDMVAAGCAAGGHSTTSTGLFLLLASLLLAGSRGLQQRKSNR